MPIGYNILPKKARNTSGTLTEVYTRDNTSDDVHNIVLDSSLILEISDA